MTQPVRGILEDEQKGILLNDFTGGLVTDIGGLSLAPNQSPDCLNVFAWEGNLRWRGGYAQFATLPGPADGAFEYFDINDNAHTIEWAAGNMYDTTAGGNPVLIASGVYTPGQRIAHAQLNGVLYWATITVPLRQYNGTTEQAVSNAGGTGVVPPPACNFLIDFNGSLVAVDFVVAGVRNPGSFMWSNVNDAHTWVGANVQAVGSNDGSVCVFALLMGVAQVGVSPTKQFMVAKNDQKIFLYEGALGSLIENPVSSPVGVLDGKSAVYMPTQAGLGAVVFLGDDQQIYQTNGIECTMISTNIKLLCSQLCNSAVNLQPNQKFNAIYHQRYQYYLIDFGNNTQLAYKWDTGAWWYFQGWPSGVFCSTIASNGLPTIFVGANNGSTTGVYELALDQTDDNGNTIQAYWSSPYIHGGKPERLKCFEQLTLFTYNVGVQYQVTSVGMPRSDGVAPATKALIFNDAAVGAVQSLPGNGMTWNQDKWNQAYWGGVQNTAGANPPINGMKGPLCVPAPATKWGPAGFPQPYETGGARFIISWNKGVPDFKVTSLKVSFIWRNENVGILPGTSWGQVVATAATSAGGTGPNKFTNTGQQVPLNLPAPLTGCLTDTYVPGNISVFTLGDQVLLSDDEKSLFISAWDPTSSFAQLIKWNLDTGTSVATQTFGDFNTGFQIGIRKPPASDGGQHIYATAFDGSNYRVYQLSTIDLSIVKSIVLSNMPGIGGAFIFPPNQGDLQITSDNQSLYVMRTESATPGTWLGVIPISTFGSLTYTQCATDYGSGLSNLYDRRILIDPSDNNVWFCKTPQPVAGVVHPVAQKVNISTGAVMTSVTLSTFSYGGANVVGSGDGAISVNGAVSGNTVGFWIVDVLGGSQFAYVFNFTSGTQVAQVPLPAGFQTTGGNGSNALCPQTTVSANYGWFIQVNTVDQLLRIPLDGTTLFKSQSPALTPAAQNFWVGPAVKSNESCIFVEYAGSTSLDPPLIGDLNASNVV